MHVNSTQIDVSMSSGLIGLYPYVLPQGQGEINIWYSASCCRVKVTQVCGEGQGGKIVDAYGK